jgi:hypothetical protein
MMHLCRTDKMFRAYTNLVRLAWLAAKQDKLWNTVEKVYLLDEKYSQWRYNITNLPGATPPNNPIESMNLVSKISDIK